MNSKNKLFLTKARLSGYKSINDVNIDFVEGLNIIIGKNAVGKTNFLNFLNSSLNLNFSNSNNFESSFTIRNNDIYYDFLFSKKTSLSFSNKEKIKFLGLKKINPTFFGKLDIVDEKNKKTANYVISDEEQSELFLESLMVDNVFLKSTLIRHGLPKNYLIIDTPLNIELINKNISDDFLNLINNDNQSSFFDRLLTSTITMDLIDNKYFNKRLKKEDSLEKFTKQKRTEYKNSVISNLSFLDELKDILKEFSPIENVRINDNFLLEIDNENEKISLKNFFLEFYIDKKWYSFDDLSDGTKRIFYIISEIFILDKRMYVNEEEKRLNVIFIEEPELGIHPFQLFNLMRFIKEKSRTNQIIITTHSPLSLDILEKDELTSIILATKSGNQTNLIKLSKEKLEKAKMYMDELNLSDFWLNSNLED